MAAFLLLGAIGYGLDLDDRVGNWYLEWRLAADEKNTSILLSNYEVTLEGHVVTCVRKNLSGITFNPDRQTLFAITNKPTAIIELTTSGNCLRQINLRGFSDTEGIAYLGDHRYAIIEEGRFSISIVAISEATDEIHRKSIMRSLQIEMKNPKNKGFEGITFHPNKDRLYIVSEKSPMMIYKVEGLVHQSDNQVDISFRRHNAIVVSKLRMEDLSGLHFDPVSNHFLFLSHESMLIAEISSMGERMGFMELEKDFAGLRNDIPQAEGITMDLDRNIYVVSEPNLFYRFSPKRP